MKNDEAKKENIEFRNYIIHYSNIRYTCNIIFNTVLSLVTLREFKPHETTMAARPPPPREKETAQWTTRLSALKAKRRVESNAFILLFAPF